MSSASSAREAGERIETLLTELEQSAPAAVSERVGELLRAVMAMYGDGLGRILELEPDITRRLADDELIGGLLVLHDLHPDDVDTRVQRALDGVRPYLGSHAGGVSYDGVDAEGVAHLRLEGSCDGCPGSTATVSTAIEAAILAAAPDVVAVETAGVVPEPRPGEPQLLQIGRYRPDECPVPS